MAWQKEITKGTLALGREDYSQAQQHFTAALNEAQQQFGEGDERLRRTLGLLGQTLLKQSAYGEAQDFLCRSVESGRRSQCSNDLGNAVSLLGLAEIRSELGDGPGANYRYQQAVELLRLPPADNEPPLEVNRKGLNNLFSDLERQEQAHEQAEFQKLLQRAKAEFEQAKANANKEKAQKLERWSMLLQSSRETIEKSSHAPEIGSQHVQAYEQALEAAMLADDIFQGHDLNLARSLSNLGICSQLLGIHDQAETLFLRANTIYDTITAAPERSRNAKLMLAEFYSSIQAYEKSLHWLLQAETLEAEERHFSSDTNETKMEGAIASAMARAELYRAFRSMLKRAIEQEECHQLEHAGLLYDRALALLRRTFPAEHPEATQTLRFKANVLREIGQPGPAQHTMAKAEALEKTHESRNQALTTLSSQVKLYSAP